MATREEMRTWFESRYETAVDAWFYDPKISDLQRVAAPVDVRQALTEQFPDTGAADIEGLATDLDTEGSWLDTSVERAMPEETA